MLKLFWCGFCINRKKQHAHITINSSEASITGRSLFVPCLFSRHYQTLQLHPKGSQIAQREFKRQTISTRAPIFRARCLFGAFLAGHPCGSSDQSGLHLAFYFLQLNTRNGREPGLGVVEPRPGLQFRWNSPTRRLAARKGTVHVFLLCARAGVHVHDKSSMKDAVAVIRRVFCS